MILARSKSGVKRTHPLFEIASVLVRLDHVAGFITKPLTTIRPLLYTRRYDYQISCAHFCNRPCQHLSCASSVTDSDRIPFTGKTPCAQKSRSDGLAGCSNFALPGCSNCGVPFARR